jgi:sugar transferase (PEP-CTERM/EpsH1 system associated)
MDFVDVDSKKWMEYSEYSSFPKSLMHRMEGRRLQRYEQVVMEEFNRCILISQAEKSEFAKFADTSNISVIGNGVNIEKYNNFRTTFGGPNNLIFIGGMNYFPYIDAMLYFVREIFPVILKAVATARLFIVGYNPVKRIQTLHDSNRILVTGFVEDVRPHLRNAAVFIAPLRMARGVQNKLLESMAMKVPVVATTKAFAGINAKPGEGILVADEPATFARETLRLLQDRQFNEEQAELGRQVVEERYAWKNMMDELDIILKEAALI